MKRRGSLLLLFMTLVLLTFPADAGAPVLQRSSAASVSGEEVLQYFCEIAFGSELGESPPFLTKWVSPVSIAVSGDPLAEDLFLIGELVAALNLVEGFPGIFFSRGEADLTVFFLSPEALEKRFSLWQRGDGGTVEYVWNRSSGVITKAAVGIDKSLRRSRGATVAEEILQALGLGQDSSSRADSLFYDGVTAARAPAAMDLLLVELLYHPSLKAGMTKEEALPVLREILGIGAYT